MEETQDKKKQNRSTGRGYMLQLLTNIGIATVISAVILVFLVANISTYSNYLYMTGNDSTAVQRFAFGQTVSVLLFVLLGILIFTTVLVILQRKTAKDIETIQRAVEQISEGDLTTQLDVIGDSELTDIADSISRMESDLRELMEQQKDSEQSKTDLITNVAHDLRTPLTSILGYLDLLMQGDTLPPDVQKRYLSIVYSKSKRLQKLIEELFGFTKLSYGRINMHVGEVDIVKLLAQLLEESYPSFEKNELSYEFMSNADSHIVEADGDLLARLFDNLISNAIKYGAEGKKVLVKIRSERGSVTVKVINYGYVIPENELPMIFDKFYRVEHSRSSQTGGTGLGLAIVKNIVDIHHGTISVSSDLYGTAFTVKLNDHFVETKDAEKNDK